MKRTLALILTIVMCISVLAVPAHAQTIPFTDVSSTYKEAVQFLYDHGLMNGVSSTKFGTSDSLQRAQVVTLLWRAAGQPNPSGTVKSFSDCISGTYYYNAVRWASSSGVGIANGYSNGKFGVTDSVTHQDAITFLYRFAKQSGQALKTETEYKNKVDGSTSKYKGKFSDYAKAAGGWAMDKGLINNTTVITPSAVCTRGNVANYMYKGFYKDQIRVNISTSPVSGNTDNAGMPSPRTQVEGFGSYYFNVQVPSVLKVKTAALYIQQPGSSTFKQVYSLTASTYLRYDYTKQTVDNTSGTLNYYWKLTFTDGAQTCYSGSVTVKAVTSTGLIKNLSSYINSYGITNGSDAYNALMSIESKYSNLVNSTTNPIVFMFEGAGNDASASKRFNAMCVVVKNKEIKFLSRNCSTLPDFPFNPSKNGGDDMPTIMAGTYNFTTVNHKDQYAALNVTDAPVVRYSGSGVRGYKSTSYGINVHKRSSDTLDASRSWVNSSGCQIIGKTDGNEYLNFCKAVGILNSGASSVGKWQNKVTGKIVIDRTQAYSSLGQVGYPQYDIDNYLR